MSALTWHVSSPHGVPLPPFLPPLEDDPPHNDDNHVEHVEGDEADGVVDGHVVGPQQGEGPEHGKDVEDDVPEKWPLGQGEGLCDGDHTHHYGGHKHAGS